MKSISYLRVVSTFAVVLLHSAAIISMDFGRYGVSAWEASVFINSCVRFCVPVFVMISGALLLGKDEPLKLFLKKRMARIFLPFLFWSTVYVLWYYKSSVAALDFKTVLRALLGGYYGGSAYHLWYLYMVLGLYAFTPVLRKFTAVAGRGDLQYFLLLGLVMLLAEEFSIAPLLTNFIYFGKYIFYYVLGFYLVKFPPNIDKRYVLTAALAVFLASTLYTFFATVADSLAERRFYPRHTYYMTWNVALQSAAVFLIFQNLRLGGSRMLAFFEKNSFGIYFIHVILLQYFFKFFLKTCYSPQVPAKAAAVVLGSAVSTFLLAVLLIALMSRIKFLKKVVQ